MLKFYEATEPYYGLIAANDKDEAAKVYVETISEYDEEDRFDLTEVSEEDARAKYNASSDVKEEGALRFDEVMKLEGADKAHLLLIDGGLL